MRRELFVWEEEQVHQLTTIIAGAQWKRSVSDGWIWNEGNLKEYTVRSGYKVLSEFGNQLSNNCFRELWSLKVAGSAQLCVWKAMLDKLPTRLNLVKRGIIIPTNLCPLCKKAEESVQHVFINCEVAQKVWDNCDRWIGISSVRQHTIVNHYQNFYLLCYNRKANVVWKSVWVAVVWEIWYHRNRIVFKNGMVDDMEISWTKFRWLRMNYSVSD